MRRLVLAVGALALAGWPRSAAAEDSYVEGLFGPALAYGGHAGAGSGDSIIGGAGAFGAIRFPLGNQFVHVGVIADFRFSHTFVGDYAIQGALYFEHDFVSLWLDPHLGLNLFYRLEPALRYIPGVSNSEFVGYGVFGVKIVGFSLALAAGAEVALAPGVTDRVGFIGETRLAVDLIEAIRFFRAYGTKTPLP